MSRQAAASAAPPALREYEARRDFAATPEPAPAAERAHARPVFVVQEHRATRLHYDFRLEAGGALKSWAVTNEPPLDPAVKRLAVRVEDHPLSYATFEGTIPAGQYRAGEVRVWDRGTFEASGSVEDGLAVGRLSFTLKGKKLNGRFTLVRMRGGPAKRENWLLIKGRDEYAKRGGEPARPRAATKRPAAPPVTVTAPHGSDGTPRVVALTNPDKVLYPDDGFTKADVAAYYRTVAPRLLPFLKDRPVTLERLPDGLGDGKPHFWQKNTPAADPDWIPRAESKTEDGKTVRYALVNDLPTLLYLVNQGALTFHPWLSRVGSADRPDFVLFDLDPGPASFADVIAVARAVRTELTRDGHAAVVKTSGKTGLHVLVPWHASGGYDDARAWALEVAQRVCEALPGVATTEVRKAKRGGRVYVDVMQNARGHHAVAPYVLRAVAGAPVSTPLRWAELRAGLDPKRFTLRTAPGRFARQKGDRSPRSSHGSDAAARPLLLTSRPKFGTRRSTMNARQRDRYRKQLQALADRVGRTTAALEDEARVPLGGEAGGGISNAPVHLGDLGTGAYAQELGATLLENEAYVRDEALAALARLDAGTFGRCMACGDDIETARLDALPYVRHCVACAAAEQSGRPVNLNDGRPESWLGAPGHEGPTDRPHRAVGRDLGAGPDDVHAAGTPGGGTEVGGLAGTNVGSGAPDGANLERAMGGTPDADSAAADRPAAGGAVGGTPANKRAKGKAGKGKSANPVPRRTKRTKE